MTELTFIGPVGPYADDPGNAAMTVRAVRIIDKACDKAGARLRDAGPVLNALLSLWINHSIRLVGLDRTLVAIGQIEDYARQCAALTANTNSGGRRH